MIHLPIYLTLVKLMLIKEKHFWNVEICETEDDLILDSVL